jgi:putative hydrolase of the HAD superfamily
VIRHVAFDADDTLWHNERIFLEARQRFIQLLAPYHDARWIEERLDDTELRNLDHYGYGIKSFTLSMIETSVELTEGRITGAEISRIVELAKEMLQTPVELLEHVAATVAALAGSYRLMIVTKGDLFDQEAKVAKSGLGDYFERVEVVPQKDRATYATIVARNGIDPGEFVMIGNSLRSDILPVVDVGAHAIYVPYATTWSHEDVPERVVSQYRFLRAQSMLDVPRLIRLADGTTSA